MSTLNIDPAIYTIAINAPRVHIDEAIATKGGRRRKFANLANFNWDTAKLREYLADHKIPIGLTEKFQISGGGPFSGVGSPMAQSYTVKGNPLYGEKDLIIPNRFAVAAMEGWDANLNGSVSDAVRERWISFSRSGAGLLWGCEAVAVRHDGRANPNQLVLNEDTFDGFKKLLADMREEQRAMYLGGKPQVIGLQLTHSGRFAAPNIPNSKEPRIAYEHSILSNDISNNGKYMTDADIDELVQDFVKAAVLAQKAGFDFVDIKHCHGYFGHELLSAFDRKDSKYGGSFENRTRFLREVVKGIREKASGLHIGVRLSVYDFVPFIKNDKIYGIGEPANIPGDGVYKNAFGGDGTGQGINLEEPIRFLNLLEALGINMVCTTAGSPYYNSHAQRSTDIPPYAAYYTPVDPLATMALQFQATAALKKTKPNMFIVGSNYSYAQGYFDRVAEYNVKNGLADAAAYGRLVLPYPGAAADILTGLWMKKVISEPELLAAGIDKNRYVELSRALCKLESYCTTGPRTGAASDCPIKKGFAQRRENIAHYRKLNKEGKILGRLELPVV